MRKAKPLLATAGLAILIAWTGCAKSAGDVGVGEPPRNDASSTPGAGSGGENNPDTSKPPSDPAPDFAVTTFDGGTFRLSEQRGTPVVLNFWESW
jgi:hypothetical protein